MRVFVLLILSAGALAACSSTPDCLKNQSYEHATAFPPLKAPPGLSISKASSDMQIPQVSAGPVATYPAAQPGTNPKNARSRCLTTPPALDSNS